MTASRSIESPNVKKQRNESGDVPSDSLRNPPPRLLILCFPVRSADQRVIPWPRQYCTAQAARAALAPGPVCPQGLVFLALKRRSSQALSVCILVHQRSKPSRCPPAASSHPTQHNRHNRYHAGRARRHDQTLLRRTLSWSIMPPATGAPRMGKIIRLAAERGRLQFGHWHRTERERRRATRFAAPCLV